MSQELEKLIDQVVEGDSQILESAKVYSGEDYKFAIKDQIRRRVYREIKEELYGEVMAKVKQDAEKEALNKEIDAIKKLTVTGLVLAFFVGLLVNQCTEVITFFKGIPTEVGLFSTGIIILVLLAACLLIVFGIIISDLLKVWKGFKK